MDKRETTCFKGVALLLMFWHHIMGCGLFLIGDVNKIKTVFSDYEVNLGIGLGWGCKVCIGLFTIASGYGLYISYIKDAPILSIFKRIFKFLLTYWVMLFLVAVPYLIITHRFDPHFIIQNLFALIHDDNMLYLSLSWYVKVYLMLLCVLPFVKIISNKIDKWPIDLFLIFASILIAKYTPSCEEGYFGKKLFVLSSLNLLCSWFPAFYAGVIAAKYDLVKKARESFLKISSERKLETFLGTCFMILISIQLIYYHSIGKFKLFTTSLIPFFFLFIFDYCYRAWDKLKINIVLNFIGKYSFQLWLLSGMFFLNTIELQWILLLPKVSVLILIWNVVILILPAMLFSFISSKLYSVSMVFFDKMTKRGGQI